MCVSAVAGLGCAGKKDDARKMGISTEQVAAYEQFEATFFKSTTTSLHVVQAAAAVQPSTTELSCRSPALHQ